jgi:hypothetical protein
MRYYLLRPDGAGSLGQTAPAVQKRNCHGTTARGSSSAIPHQAGTDLFGRDIAAGIKACLIHHEQLNVTTGI